MYHSLSVLAFALHMLLYRSRSISLEDKVFRDLEDLGVLHGRYSTSTIRCRSNHCMQDHTTGNIYVGLLMYCGRNLSAPMNGLDFTTLHYPITAGAPPFFTHVSKDSTLVCRQFSRHKRTLRWRRIESPLRTDGITPLRTVEGLTSLRCKHGDRADNGNDAVAVKRAYGLRSKQSWD